MTFGSLPQVLWMQLGHCIHTMNPIFSTYRSTLQSDQARILPLEEMCREYRLKLLMVETKLTLFQQQGDGHPDPPSCYCWSAPHS